MTNQHAARRLLSRRSPLSASRNFYPGFFGALFLIFLRVAIGWHFLNEGSEKMASYQRGGKPFTAEPYLRASAGPFAGFFRAMIPDVDSLDKLDPEKLKAAWTADVDRIKTHYALAGDQVAKATAELEEAKKFVDLWFGGRDFSEKRAKYLHDLGAVNTVETEKNPMSFELERAADKRKELEKDRRDLIKEIDARAVSLKDAVAKLATPEQIAAAGPYKAPWTEVDRINMMTTYGLFAIGLCLMLGLFTRLAATGGVIFLAQIYLSMPPWPGLPANPLAEGHYFIVNKNLVEMFALAVLATLPTGQWVGLDAVLFGRFRRNREARASLEEAAEPSAPRTRTVTTRL